MRTLFTILFLCVVGLVNGQYTLAGYISSSNEGGPAQACYATNLTTPIYSVGGVIGNDIAVYTSPSGGQITDYSWRGFTTTLGGAATHSMAMWGDGTVKNYTACSGGGGGAVSSGPAPAPAAWGKKIKPRVMMDFQRFDQFNGGGGSMAAMFDDSTNTDWYPIRNLTDWIKFGWDATHQIYWHGNRGLRMLWDLVGDTSILDLSKRYKIRDTVYYFDKTFNTGNATFYMAFVDSVIANVPWYNRHYYFARPDSLLKPFAKFAPNNGASWQGTGLWRSVKTLRQDSGRYILAWGVSDTLAQNHAEYPNFGELSFYGIPNFDSANINGWTDYPVQPQNRDLAKFAGMNMGGLYYTQALKHRFGLRLYSLPFYAWDSDSTTAYPNNIWDANPYPTSPAWAVLDSLRELGTKPYIALAGGSYRHRWQTGTSATANPDKIPPTEHMAEIEDYNSYTRSADFMKHFAAKFGRNTKGLTEGQLRWNNESPTGLGHHWYDYIENGNEEQHRNGLSELGLFLRSSMDYDGHAGRYNLGIRAADDSMKLIMAAPAAPDTNRTKMWVYFSHFFRPDSLFFFDAVTIHLYSSTWHKQFGYAPTLEGLVGATGATPEYDSIKIRMKGIIQSAHRYVRKPINVDWNEYGYDNFQEPIPNATALEWTPISSPDYPNFDSLQDKAISIEATIMEGYAAGVNNMVEFMSENPCYCPNNNSKIFNTSGEIAEWTGYLATQFYPHHHTKNWHSKMLSGWAWDSEIRGNAADSVRIYKLRKIAAPDSVCYYVRYWPLDDAGQAVTLNVGSVTGNGTKKYLNFTDTQPTESAAVVTSGNVSAIAQARAQYYFFQETTAPIPPTIQQQIRFSNRLKFTQ